MRASHDQALGPGFRGCEFSDKTEYKSTYSPCPLSRVGHMSVKIQTTDFITAESIAAS